MASQYFNADLCGGLPALLARMLVDSQPGWIDLLPATPRDWPVGNIEGIRARGHIEVRRLKWNEDDVRAVLRSDIAQSVEVRLSGRSQRTVALPKGFASPGDLVPWHGRWLLPYQSYPSSPVRLCFSECADLKTWSAPKFFLEAAAELPWNTARRVIDPTFVVDGDTLNCFFVGSASRPNAAGKTIRANLMGHARPRDPQLQHWEILSRDAPLIGFSATAPDGVENTMIIRIGDHCTMIYSECLENQHLALATSPDLIQWQLEGPMEFPRQKWMARKFRAPFVWREGGQWLMILMGTNAQDRTTFGLLTSPDGRRWAPLAER